MTEQLSVLEWAEERLANTLHIAPTTTGKDRAGWLEDAAYWSAIVDELREVRLLRAELQATQAVVTDVRPMLCDILKLCSDVGAGNDYEAVARVIDRIDAAQAHPTPAQEADRG